MLTMSVRTDRTHRGKRLLFLVLLLLVALPALLRPAAAHDLPAEIRVQMHAQPVDQRLQVAIRVPLALLEGMALPKRGAGYLALGAIEEPLERSAEAVAAAFPFFADGEPLAPAQGAWRVSMPSEDAFGSLEQAKSHILGPALPNDANVFWNQGYFDAYFEYPISRPDADFAMLTDVRGLSGILKLELHFQPAEGPAQRFELHGDHGLLPLDPAWYQTVARFAGTGVTALLASVEAVLFLVCLVLPFRLVPVGRLATAIGLFAGALALAVMVAGAGLATGDEWLTTLSAALAALAILAVAVEDVIAGWRGGAGALQVGRPVAAVAGIALGFGLTPLVMEELQFAGAWPTLALLAFVAGLVAGIGALLLVALPVLQVTLTSRRVRRTVMIVCGALIAHTGWHWLLERVEALRFVRWPTPDEGGGVAAAALLLILAAGLLLWRSRGRLLLQPSAKSNFP